MLFVDRHTRSIWKGWLLIAIAGTAAYNLVKIDLFKRRKEWYDKVKADEAEHGPREKKLLSCSTWNSTGTNE